MSQIKELFEKLPSVFKADKAKGLNLVFQYDITGEGGGKWYVIVNDGKCEVKEGTHPSPSVTLMMDSSTYLAMAERKLTGIQAYISGKLKISGNIMLVQKFAELFSM